MSKPFYELGGFGNKGNIITDGQVVFERTGTIIKH